MKMLSADGKKLDLEKQRKNLADMASLPHPVPIIHSAPLGALLLSTTLSPLSRKADNVPSQSWDFIYRSSNSCFDGHYLIRQYLTQGSGSLRVDSHILGSL